MKKELIKMQKETIAHYLKRIEKLCKEIDFYSPGITKLRNDLLNLEDPYLEKVLSEIDSHNFCKNNIN